MRKNNKKGFTIVELAIVIAVIAILAGVLIPTFASVVTKANESKALQEARNIYTEYVAVVAEDGGKVESVWIKVGNYYVQVENGELVDSSVTNDAPDGVDYFVTAASMEGEGTITTEPAPAASN